MCNNTQVNSSVLLWNASLESTTAQWQLLRKGGKVLKSQNSPHLDVWGGDMLQEIVNIQNHIAETYSQRLAYFFARRIAESQLSWISQVFLHSWEDSKKRRLGGLGNCKEKKTVGTVGFSSASSSESMPPKITLTVPFGIILCMKSWAGLEWSFLNTTTDLGIRKPAHVPYTAKAKPSPGRHGKFQALCTLRHSNRKAHNAQLFGGQVTYCSGNLNLFPLHKERQVQLCLEELGDLMKFLCGLKSFNLSKF